MEEIMLKIDNVSKEYRLGQIGGTTLRDELQRFGAKLLGKEDPTRKIGAKNYNRGETFMALDGVSFEVKKGERVGIIGHNGAGKSTLLKLISRITAPSGGSIGLNGRVASMLEVGTGFHPELTGRENIYMNGAILGMSKKEIDAKIEDIIEFSECRQFIDTPVKRYSSGMYVKLAFSVAAHLDSEIVIMDEVLAVGDAQFQKKCLDKMEEVSKRNGRTVLYVSHNMNTVKQLCERVIMLDHGKVVFNGSVDEGISRYLGVNGEDSLHFDLESLSRDKNSSNSRAKLLELEILDKDFPVFEGGERIKAKLTWTALEDCEDVFVRFIFRYTDSSPAGMATTIVPMSLKAGETMTKTLRFDLRNFASGKYYASAAIYKSVVGDGHDILDAVNAAIRFTVENNEPNTNHLPVGMQHKYWGHAVFPAIEIEE